MHLILFSCAKLHRCCANGCAKIVHLHNQLFQIMATVKAIVRTTKKSVDVNIRFRISDGRNVQLFHNSELRVNVDVWDAKNDCIKARAIYTGDKNASIRP